MSEAAAVPDSASKTPPRKPAKWGDPLFKLDVIWTRFESRLAVSVLGLEIFALTLWVLLKGMSTAPDSGSAAGTVMRALLGAFALGMLAFHLLKKQSMKVRRWAAFGGIVLGMVLSKVWVNVGVQYFANLLNWYQQASTLTLFGGLRGIGTRLTMLLALLGASLATASGKHITIDFVTRFISDKARLPVVVLGWLMAAVVCLAASWGFFEHIAIESFGARMDATTGEKLAQVKERFGEYWFVFISQLTLDMKSVPHVFGGENYAQWLHGTEWNQWLLDRGFVERYGAEAVEMLKMPADSSRSPMVAIPEVGEPRGELINAANLVFAIGLVIMSVRFVLRSLLALSGHVSVDPDAGGEFTTDQVDAKTASA